MWGRVLSWLAVVVGVGLGGYAAVNWTNLLAWMKSHQELSGWVQAVGSILSIWGGFAVARYTMARSEARAAATAKATVQAVADSASKHALDYFGSAVIGNANAPDLRVFSPSKFVNAMDRVPLHAVADPIFVASFIELQGTIDELFKRCTNYHDAERRGENDPAHARERERLERLKSRTEELRDQVLKGQPAPWVPPTRPAT